MTVPRGIRNNNPGNLRRSATAWQGLAAEQSDPDFLTFTDATHGLRALARTLYEYDCIHSIDTIRGAVARFAPSADHNDTDAYVDAVAGETRFGADTHLDFGDPDVLAPIVKAIVRHENGEQPYLDAQIAKAVAEAVEKPS